MILTVSMGKPCLVSCIAGGPLKMIHTRSTELDDDYKSIITI